MVDTPEHADFFARFTHRGRRHFAVLWVGAEEARFVTAADPGDDAPILWYLTYIPLHGFETVARAAALLADDNRTFRLVGDGQRPRRGRSSSPRELGLTNIEFVAPVPEAELPGRDRGARRSASACSARATRRRASCPTRCSSARPRAGRSITAGDARGRQRAFGDALVTVPVGDAHALADAIRELRGPQRLAVAARARAVFEQRYSEAALADELALILASTHRNLEPA